VALLGGVGTSLAANVAAAEPTTTARIVAGWPALAFAVAFELLLQQRRASVSEPVVGPVESEPDQSRPVPDQVPTAPAKSDIDLLAELEALGKGNVSETVTVMRSVDQPDRSDEKSDHPDQRSLDSTASDDEIVVDLRNWAVDEGRPISRDRVMRGYGIGATRTRRLRDGLKWPDRSDQQADRSGEAS